MSTLEALIQSHKPSPRVEREPASKTQLEMLNINGLIGEAVDEARFASGSEDDEPVTVTKLTAWSILADAQRDGMVLHHPHDLKRVRRNQG